MNNTDLILTAALVATNTGWALAYRQLRHKSLELLGALWAQMLDRRQP